MAKVIPKRLVSLCPVELSAPFDKSTFWSLQVSWVEFICSEEVWAWKPTASLCVIIQEIL